LTFPLTVTDLVPALAGLTDSLTLALLDFKEKNGRQHKKIEDLKKKLRLPQKNENGRRPQFFLKIKDDLNLTLEHNLNFLKMEDNLIFI
jgi:hypothetical protein